MIVLFSHLLAQTALPDPLGGWGTLLLNLGSFGLVCYIVIKQLPDFLRETRMEREARDKLFSTVIDSIQTKADARNHEVVQAVEKQTEAFEAGVVRIEAAVVSACQYRRQEARA